MATETVTYCARHPKEETGVSCATCGTPICPKCMVTTPVGMKCRDCGTARKSSLYQVRPERLLSAGITALVAGAIAAIIGEIGFFAIFIATAYGYAAGSAILKASGMKRGKKLELTAGAGMVIGALAVKILPAAARGSLTAGSHIGMMYVGLPSLVEPLFWLAVIIATACAVSKIRYL